MNRVILLLFMISLLTANAGWQQNDGLNDRPKKFQHQTKAPIKEKWHWGSAQKQNKNSGYAQVVKAGNTIYISGVPTVDLSLNDIFEVYKIIG